MTNITVNGVDYRWYLASYLIGKDGSVLHRGQPYQPYIRKDGYLAIRRDLIHRIVAALWIPNPENAPFVHHIDGNKTNNHISNLEWVTPKQHVAERHKDTIGKHIVSDATKQKLREQHLGRKLSDEHKRKISEGVHKADCRPKNPCMGRIKTPEELAKIIAANNQPCEIDGVVYPSMKIASQTLGIFQGTIRRRCLSKNFTTYKWLPKT